MIGYDPSAAPSPAKSAGKVHFKAPAGLGLETKREGDELEVVAKIRVEGDGVCLISVNGIALSGNDTPKAEPKPATNPEPVSETPEDFTAAVERRASQLTPRG